MSFVTRSARAHIDAATGMFAPQVSGNVYAGEDLDPVAPCRIASTGLVYMCNASSGSGGDVIGFTPKLYKSGEPVRLFGAGTRANYGSGLTPGARFYLGTTKGRLDTAPTADDQKGVAIVLSATDILIVRADGVVES